MGSVNGKCLTGTQWKEFKELIRKIVFTLLLVLTLAVRTCLPAREPPQKVRGLGEFFDWGRGEVFPSWVWATPKVLASQNLHFAHGTCQNSEKVTLLLWQSNKLFF